MAGLITDEEIPSHLAVNFVELIYDDDLRGVREVRLPSTDLPENHVFDKPLTKDNLQVISAKEFYIIRGSSACYLSSPLSIQALRSLNHTEEVVVGEATIKVDTLILRVRLKEWRFYNNISLVCSGVLLKKLGLRLQVATGTVDGAVMMLKMSRITGMSEVTWNELDSDCG